MAFGPRNHSHHGVPFACLGDCAGQGAERVRERRDLVDLKELMSQLVCGIPAAQSRIDHDWARALKNHIDLIAEAELANPGGLAATALRSIPPTRFGKP